MLLNERVYWEKLTPQYIFAACRRALEKIIVRHRVIRAPKMYIPLVNLLLCHKIVAA